MQSSSLPKLGDLIRFIHSSQPGEFGIVIRLDIDHAEVMWPWGNVECSYETFTGGRWGNLEVVTDDN
jgi:hypothetical protein